MNSQVLTNAKIVLGDEIVDGSLFINDGLISDIDSQHVSIPSAVDIGGDYLIPGLVELHTDNLEKHFTPRPKVTWPGAPAVIAHDAQLIAAGITTVFDAVALGDVNESSQRIENLYSMLNAIQYTQNNQLLRADHRLHLRCEVCHKDVLHLFEGLVDKALVNLVSIMDHSPGQRQFINLDKYRIYYQGKYNLSNDELEKFIIQQQENSARYSDIHRQKIVAMCHERHIALASHDDATLAHVIESANFGMAMAEFPTTLEAAQASHERGMSVLMGAPNIVRGGSHSGNIAAHILAEKELLDILSSDYYPASMLHAAFILADLDNNYDLPEAICTVTKNPAQASGLTDRGEIKTGNRADVVQVSCFDNFPVVKCVWGQGVRLF